MSQAISDEIIEIATTIVLIKAIAKTRKTLDEQLEEYVQALQQIKEKKFYRSRFGK